MTMTVAEHSEQWVMASVAGANPDLAREYGAYVTGLDEAGELGLASHDHLYPEWAARNTAECFQCGATAHRIAGTATLVCGDCGCSRTVADAVTPAYSYSSRRDCANAYGYGSAEEYARARAGYDSTGTGHHPGLCTEQCTECGPRTV